MTDILGIGSSGLTAYRKLLETTGNNIANANTDGYVRRDVVLASVGEAQMLPTTKISASGSGVSVDLVRRASDAFLQSQVRNAYSREARSQILSDGLVKLEKAVLAPEHNIGTTVQEFFSKMQDLTLSPSSTSMRLTLIDAGQRVAERFRVTASNIRDEINSAETSIDTTITAINSITAQLGSLNREIIRSGSGPQKLNDLLDQRDKLLKDISKLTNVTVEEKSTGEIDLYLGDSASGPQLVDFDRSFDLGMNVDGDRIDFIYDPYGAGSITNQVTGGAIAGQRNFRSEALNLLASFNRLAVGLTNAINEQHRQGIDLKGAIGRDIFSTESIIATASDLNQGNAKVSVQIEAAADINNGSYILRYDNNKNQWSVKSSATGASVYGNSPLHLDGLIFSVEGKPFDGDVFIANPLEDAAIGMHFLTEDPSAIAAAMPLYVDPSVNNNSSGQLNLKQWDIKVPAPVSPPLLTDLFKTRDGDTLAFRRDDEAFTIPSGTKDATISSIGKISSAHFTPETFNIVVGTNAGTSQINIKTKGNNPYPEASYQARFDGASRQWIVTSDQTGKSSKGDAIVSIDGSEFSFSGTPADGDSFRIDAFASFSKKLKTNITFNIDLSQNGAIPSSKQLVLDGADTTPEGMARSINNAARSQNMAKAIYASVVDGAMTINALSGYSIRSASLSGNDSYGITSLINAKIEDPLEAAQIHVKTTEGRELLTAAMSGWRGIAIDKHIMPIAIENITPSQPNSSYSCIIKVPGEPLRDAALKADDGSIAAGGVYALDVEGCQPIRLAGSAIIGQDNNGIVDSFFESLNEQASIRSWSGNSIDFSSLNSEKILFRVTVDGEDNDVTFFRSKDENGQFLSTGRFEIDGASPLNFSILSDGEPNGHIVFTLPKKLGTVAPLVQVSGTQASKLGIQEPIKSRLTGSGNLVDASVLPQTLRVKIGSAEPVNVTINSLSGNDASGLSWGLVDGKLMLEAQASSINLVPSNKNERDAAARLGFYGADLDVEILLDSQGQKSLKVVSQVATSHSFVDVSASVSRIGTTIRISDKLPEDLIVSLETLSADSQRVISTRFPQELTREEPRLGDINVRIINDNQLEIIDAISGHIVALRSYVIGDPVQYLGLSFTLRAPLTSGDSFNIRWDDSRTGDNRNIVAMTQLQESDIFGEKRGSFQDIYSATAAKLGNTSQSAATDMSIAGKAASDLQSAYESKTGVSLDKEASDLIRYQQAYQAAAQVVSTARTMFDTILKIL
jgi:flagellar hook-associated protein FlgK